MRSQQATQEFAKAAESFTDIVYQQPDSLKPAADKLKLTIQTASNVGAHAGAGRYGRAGQPQLPERAVRARHARAQAQHRGDRDRAQPAGLGPRRRNTRRRARCLSTRSRTRCARSSSPSAPPRWPRPKARPSWRPGRPSPAARQLRRAGRRVSRLETQSQPAPVIEGALRADTGKLPALVGVDLGAQGYAVVRVNKTVPRDAARGRSGASRRTQQFAQAVGAAENAGLLQPAEETASRRRSWCRSPPIRRRAPDASFLTLQLQALWWL